MALNLDAALEQLFRGEILSEETVKEVCERLKESMIYQPNVQPIKAPVTVVGNLHGYESDESWQLRENNEKEFPQQKFTLFRRKRSATSLFHISSSGKSSKLLSKRAQVENIARWSLKNGIFISTLIFNIQLLKNNLKLTIVSLIFLKFPLNFFKLL